MASGTQLVRWLEGWGVSSNLIVYPNTKWVMAYDILNHYASSLEEVDRRMLFKIIEEMTHPLIYGGDKDKSLNIQDEFSSYLQYDGLCFSNGKIVKANEELIREVDNRQRQRKQSTAPIGIDGDFINSLDKLFGIQKKHPVEPSQLIQKVEIIGGKIEIEGLKDEFKKRATNKKENKFPYKLPAGTKWEDFIIKFLDEENVFIQVKQFKHTANYKEMGFIGKGGNPNPSEAWVFMKVLARTNGELTIKDLEARDKYKKQKELLAKSLQNYFTLEYDPFYPYHSSSEKEGNSYKIKIMLIPPPAINEKDDIDEDKDDLGLKEYFDKQAPQTY